MTKQTIEAAVKAAKAFIEQAGKIKGVSWSTTVIETGRESATLRRRSMDLTNALVDLRNPNK